MGTDKKFHIEGRGRPGNRRNQIKKAGYSAAGMPAITGVLLGGCGMDKVRPAGTEGSISVMESTDHAGKSENRSCKSAREYMGGRKCPGIR